MKEVNGIKVFSILLGKLLQNVFYQNGGETQRQEKQKLGDPNPRRGKEELQYGGEGRPQRDSCVPGWGGGGKPVQRGASQGSPGRRLSQTADINGMPGVSECLGVNLVTW